MTTAFPIDVQELARHIALRMDPDALLDAADVGAMLGCEARYVLTVYTLAPGFPKALRLTLPGGKRSHPRWKRREVQAWVDSHAEGRVTRGGRPRNAATI